MMLNQGLLLKQDPSMDSTPCSMNHEVIFPSWLERAGIPALSDLWAFTSVLLRSFFPNFWCSLTYMH